MAAKSSALTLAYVALLLFSGGCARHSSAFPLDMRTIREFSRANTSRLSFEESGDGFEVTVIDRYGDAHIHHLAVDGTTRQQALDLLKQKQAELVGGP